MTSPRTQPPLKIRREPLSRAKARLSEVVRYVRGRRVSVIITVDGVPAVEMRPLPEEPLDMTPSQLAAERALAERIRKLAKRGGFDAVELVRDGRR